MFETSACAQQGENLRDGSRRQEVLCRPQVAPQRAAAVLFGRLMRTELKRSECPDRPRIDREQLQQIHQQFPRLVAEFVAPMVS
jgi:hypothetical protein